MTTVYIGVGTNIEPEKHARVAIDKLSQIDQNIKVSSLYESDALGFDGAPFINFVVAVETPLSLAEFARNLRDLESQCGRPTNAQKYQNRNIDLDILLFGDEVSTHSPVVPREDIFKYPFVTQPLYELCPKMVIPQDGRMVKEIWQTMENLSSLRKVDLA